MTSMLPEEETIVVKMKQKLMNDVHGKDETRSFLSFSRENLSISQSDLEQGFNKHRFTPNRYTLLSVAALLVALLSLGLEIWRLHCSLANAREIEELKRDVESLKHRFLEEDLLDEMKAFEEQLYAGESSDGDDPGEADMDNADYDSNYDDDTFPSHDYSSDLHTPPIYGTRPSDFPDSSSTIAPVPSPPEPKEKGVMELLAAVRNAEKERLLEERKKKIHEEQPGEQRNNTKHKRDVKTAKELLSDWRTVLKQKRSTGEAVQGSRRMVSDRHAAKNQSRRMISGFGGGDSLEEKPTEAEENTSILVRGRHPPKKYYTHSFSDPAHASSNGQSIEARPKKSSRKLRKNLHMPRRIHAVHYAADFASRHPQKDEHTGNGRLRHENSVFKAWKPSKWVTDLKMNEYFVLTDGNLTVKESGLYLAYAQIHYMDEHNEVGFHLLVNNQPILQCMIYNPSNKRSSQSCFSAQLTYLRSEDVLVLKEIGSSRFALFHPEKSFFGLVKLGETMVLN